MGKFSLEGKTALVTGASSGIGREIARCLAAEGSHCIITALPQEEAELVSLKNELVKKHGNEIWHLTGDLSEPDGPEVLYRRVCEEVDTIDLLVNNAGIMAYGLFHEIPLSSHEKLLAVNIMASMKLMHLFLPHLISQGSGRILNVSSVGALAPTPHHAFYGAAKALLQNLSEAMAQELKGTGVSIHTLNPGYTETPMVHGENFPHSLLFYRFAGLKPPDAVARKGISALKRGKSMCVPGFRLKVFFSLLARMVPRNMVAWVSQKMTQ